MNSAKSRRCTFCDAKLVVTAKRKYCATHSSRLSDASWRGSSRGMISFRIVFWDTECLRNRAFWEADRPILPYKRVLSEDKLGRGPRARWKRCMGGKRREDGNIWRGTVGRTMEESGMPHSYGMRV